MQRSEHAFRRAVPARPAVLALSALAAGLALSATPVSAQDSWEIDASVDGPKIVSLPLRSDPNDEGSPILVHRSYAYVVLSLSNSSENPAPLSLGVYTQEMSGDTAASRARAALLANEMVTAAIRDAEGDEELADVYSAADVLEGDSSVQLFAVLARDFVPSGGDGEPSRALEFPAASDLIVRGLRFQIEEQDGSEVAVAEDWVSRVEYSDGSFDAGSGSFRSAGDEAGIPIGSTAESWETAQLADCSVRPARPRKSRT